MAMQLGCRLAMCRNTSSAAWQRLASLIAHEVGVKKGMKLTCHVEVVRDRLRVLFLLLCAGGGGGGRIQGWMPGWGLGGAQCGVQMGQCRFGREA